ncbi:MAG: orotate phosphoribosyltransferase [Gammaproteobacteria bacterium RIFCSPHIGHO2_12_FULL_45_12]|nr:MAG: orotate phosphoribosyltransferase [Gammaproteobacteria bacterium RIFCSPHIGHO2_12_FULL_45_12]
MLNHSLVTSLYQIGAIQFGHFTLKSGQTSSIYINLRKIVSYPNLLRSIAIAMWDKVKHYQFDLICGVPYTALPIATCISLEHHIPMIMRRKEKKDYGTKQLIEGEFKPGQNCLIIEDVVTTGGSILETFADIEQSQLTVTHLVALIDREQGGKEKLEENGQFKLHTVFTLTDLLQILLKIAAINSEERCMVEQLILERSL